MIELLKLGFVFFGPHSVLTFVLDIIFYLINFNCGLLHFTVL